MKLLVILGIFTVSLLSCCHGGEDHINPFDMGFDPASETTNKKDKDETYANTNKVKDTTNSKHPEQESKMVVPSIVATTKEHTQHCTDKNVGSVLLKNFVKMFLSYFDKKSPESSQEYHVWVKLSKAEYTILQRFSNDQSNIHDAHEVLVNMISGVTKSNVGTAAKMSLWFEEKTGASLDSILKVVTIVCLVSMVLYLEIGVHVSWRRRLTQLIMLAFFISIPMTWYELYKTAQINQQTVTMKEAPKECVQDMDEESLWSVYTTAFKHIFTFQKDNCQHYYEHLLIDPFLKVTPTKAIAVTFVRFFLSPLKDVGTACSEFMRALFIDLPLTMYPIAIITVSLFFFLFLFMWFGYSIRLPFFLSIEPSPVMAVTGSSVDDTLALEDVKKQLEALQDSIQTSDTHMAGELRKLAEVQTRSIEYTVGAVTANVAPPTLGPAITLDRSDISFESMDDIDIKSPNPCSDDSASIDSSNIKQGNERENMQKVTQPVDNIGPDNVT